MFPGLQTLRSKLVAVFLAPTLVIILLYGSLAYFAGRAGLEEELGKRLVAVGQTLSSDLSEGFEAGQLARLDATKARSLARLTETLTKARERTGVRRIFLVDRELRSLVDTDPGVAFGDHLYALEADRLELDRTFTEAVPTTSVLFTGDDGRRYKTGFAPVTDDGEVVAVLGVEASATYFDQLNDFATALTGLGALSLLLVVVAGAVFAGRLTRPVNRLVDAVRGLGRGELDRPIVETPIAGARSSGGIGETRDEIAFLSHAIEEMRRDVLSRDRQMQMMLSGIAHEVRNPLGGMELFCGLLAEDLRDDAPGAERAERLDKVARIQRELGYLERVVTDFLEFARAQPLEAERFDAAELLAEIDALLSGEMGELGCGLRVEVEPAGLELTGDRAMLRRALINVVRNAYQACGDDGRVVLVVRADGPSWRELRVEDNGPGIPPERVEEILTPFYTTKEKGSGLGLALTRQIIERHGGELRVEEAGAGGAAFVFRLPFDDSIEPAGRGVPEGWLG